MLREYIWMDDLPVAMVDGTGASPVVYYIHTDQIGSPQKVTDASGHVVWDGVFDPFGNAVTNTGANWGTGIWDAFTWEPATPQTMPLRFPGQYSDAETALNQNWFRDYDPSIGRYIESDPAGLLAGPNTYTYGSNNPLVRSDALGLSWSDWPWWPWNWGKSPPAPAPKECPSDRLNRCADAWAICLGDRGVPEARCHEAVKRCIDHPQVPMIFPGRGGTFIPPAKSVE